MAVFNCQGTFDFLNSRQKSFLSLKFSQAKAKIMPHEIAAPIGISYAEAVAILAALQAARLCQNYIVVYHSCEPDYTVEYIPLERGFPNDNWICPNCQEELENLNELSFGILSVSCSSIEFI